MATAVTSPDLVPLALGSTPDAPVRRPRVLLVGTAMASAASVAAFAGLIGAYLAVRSEWLSLGRTWLPEGSTIPLSPGNMSMFTLIMSLVTVQWAVFAGRNRDRPHAYQALVLTMLLGISHIVQMGFLFTQWHLPLNGDTTFQAVLIYTIIGLHLAMVTAALVFIALMTVRSLGGQFTGRDAEGLSAAAMYWYVTVAVFSVLWYAILIVK